MARIVVTDNFDRDYVDEKFILWTMPEEDAKAIADVLNKRAGPYGSSYYKVAENDYKLYIGSEH